MDEKNLYLESLKHRNYDMYKYFKKRFRYDCYFKGKDL